MKSRTALMISWLMFTLPIAAEDGPLLAFERLTHDFGVVDRGKNPRVDFVFRNTGNQPLQIKAIKPACGCTTVEQTASLYAPGQSGKIPIQFASGRFSGKINKTIVVQSNAGEHVLSISADVQAMVNVMPERIDIVRLSRREKMVKTIRLETQKLEKLEILDASIDNPSFQIASRAVDKQKVLFRVSFDAREATPGKPRERATLTIQTNGLNAADHRITIPISVSLDNPLKADPAVINFFGLDAEKIHQRQVQVQSDWPDPFNITGIESDGDMVRAEPLEDDPNSIQVTFTPNGFRGKDLVRVWITVHTDLPEQPKVSIPVRIRMP